MHSFVKSFFQDIPIAYLCLSTGIQVVIEIGLYLTDTKQK